jgi:hypothetical protein
MGWPRRESLWTIRGDPAFSCVDVRLAGDTPMVRGERRHKLL